MHNSAAFSQQTGMQCPRVKHQFSFYGQDWPSAEYLLFFLALWLYVFSTAINKSTWSFHIHPKERTLLSEAVNAIEPADYKVGYS